jgi:hypothetical protein
VPAALRNHVAFGRSVARVPPAGPHCRQAGSRFSIVPLSSSPPLFCSFSLGSLVLELTFVAWTYKRLHHCFAAVQEQTILGRYYISYPLCPDPPGTTSSSSSSPVRPVFLCRSVLHDLTAPTVGDAAVGKSSLLVRLTDQRFLANPDPTVRTPFMTSCATTSDLTRRLPLCDTLAWRRVWLEADRDQGRRQDRQAAVCVLFLFTNV